MVFDIFFFIVLIFYSVSMSHFESYIIENGRHIHLEQNNSEFKVKNTLLLLKIYPESSKNFFL